MALQNLNIAHSNYCMMRCMTLTSVTSGDTQGKRAVMASTKSHMLTAFTINLQHKRHNFLLSFCRLPVGCQRQAQPSALLLLSIAKIQKSLPFEMQHSIGRAAHIHACASCLPMGLHKQLYTCPCTCLYVKPTHVYT